MLKSSPSHILHNEHKPWLKQPGECCDKRGVPIYPGDLLKSFHFQGARWRKKYYLYHTAVYENEAMWMVPTSHLEPTKVKGGGKCLLSDDLAGEAEVIAGCGPEDFLDYTDRPKRGDS
jgi:hypothetical protein